MEAPQTAREAEVHNRTKKLLKKLHCIQGMDSSALSRLQAVKGKLDNLVHEAVVSSGVLLEKLTKACKLAGNKIKVAESIHDTITNMASTDVNPLHKPSIKDFELVKPIGKGAYGRVFLVRRKATGDLFALKVIKKQETVHKNQQKNVKMERDIMANVSNPFVVRLFYTFQNNDNLFWVMEYVNGGDLYSLLANFSYFGEEMARMYAAEIVLALEYLHHKVTMPLTTAPSYWGERERSRGLDTDVPRGSFIET